MFFVLVLFLCGLVDKALGTKCFWYRILACDNESKDSQHGMTRPFVELEDLVIESDRVLLVLDAESNCQEVPYDEKGFVESVIKQAAGMHHPGYSGSIERDWNVANLDSVRSCRQGCSVALDVLLQQQSGWGYLTPTEGCWKGLPTSGSIH
ncbi:hypothetical protein CEXT_762361 [Caerostris extrusa]|uniref:Uncharacterized protein n=1 Tax=Caerostris extrusa TaxID=172846 RepID=A0AAV4SYP0_CAEEX|nr:hypothetical protein CEXT_762361 [Caerostris extrusa]